MRVLPQAPFGRVLTAMVTPFDAEGDLDLAGAQSLAARLVGHGNDGLVLNGTTGEAPTTSDDEKVELIRSVREAVGDDIPLLAGVGSYDTAHSIEMAQAAEKAGADALLVVSPYYNKPPQAGLIAHVHAIAEATGLPIMLYDIPGRTGVPFASDTLKRLAEHDQVVAVKDAKDDLVAAAEVLAATDLAWYSGTDALNLPLLSIGACGYVSVTAHLVGRELAAMTERWDAGDSAGALAIHRRLLPVQTGFFRTQGVILVKAALAHLGLPGGPVRLPLVDATPEQLSQLIADCALAGIPLAAAA
jgi:4-hydroxy-tetrahydrodipicolinate synthase